MEYEQGKSQAALFLMGQMAASEADFLMPIWAVSSLSYHFWKNTSSYGKTAAVQVNSAYF